MTLGTSLAACVSIPLVLFFGAAPVNGGLDGLAAAISRTGLAVMAVSAVPLLAGMALRRYMPGLVERWAALLEPAATVVFFCLVAAAFYQNWDAMVAYAPQAGPAAVLLNLGALAAAFAGGAVMRLPARQKLAIAIECGLQNVAMAMYVAASVLHDESLMIPALVYAVVMNVTALALLAGGRLTIARASNA
jgi:BASS family bile acid:Na+ symporter